MTDSTATNGMGEAPETPETPASPQEIIEHIQVKGQPWLLLTITAQRGKKLNYQLRAPRGGIAHKDIAAHLAELVAHLLKTPDNRVVSQAELQKL